MYWFEFFEQTISIFIQTQSHEFPLKTNIYPIEDFIRNFSIFFNIHPI